MDLDTLANLLARLHDVPMPADTLAQVKGAVFLAAAGVPAEHAQ